MFHVRAYLTNTYLACFDLSVVAGCCLFVRRDTSLVQLAFALTVWLSLSLYFGMYRSRRMNSPIADLKTLLPVSVAAWLVLGVVSPLVPSLAPLRSGAIWFVALSFVVLSIARTALRLFVQELRRHGYDIKRLVLVTTPELGLRLTEKIQRRAHYGYRIVRGFEYLGADVHARGFVAEVREFLDREAVDDVIIALPAEAKTTVAELIGLCEGYGVSVRVVPDIFPLIQTDTQIYDFDGIPVVNARLYPTEYLRYAVLKRAFDVVASVIVLTVLSPAFLILALIVRSTSTGPVFFSQERIGLNGRRFRMLKFRTMYQSPALDPDSHWTVRNDRHITPAGRWLRRTNLDELPQFINVLKGEMSIVGPRPERPFFLERFRREVPDYMARHYVKSGMTGWAQVHGLRGDTPIPQRVAHDLYYIRNWAVALDIKILFLTLRTFFQRESGT